MASSEMISSTRESMSQKIKICSMKAFLIISLKKTVKANYFSEELPNTKVSSETINSMEKAL